MLDHVLKYSGSTQDMV